MKGIGSMLLAIVFALSASAQLQITEPDKSPLDVSYHPHGYPILKFQTKKAPATPHARVIYSRPQKNGRTIFGDVVKYNELWRLGANECTEIEFYKEVTIGKAKLPKGKYALFCIPQAGQWTIIFNKGVDAWGAFSYDKKKDVLRTSIKVANAEAVVEFFTMVFDNSGNLVILWDNQKALLPIKYAAK